MALIHQIQKYAQQRPLEWINGGVFETKAMTEWVSEDGKHYKPSHADRRLRDLVEAGIFARRKNEKRCEEYRYVGLMSRTKEKEEATLFAR